MKKLNLLFTALLLLFSLTATAHEFKVDGIYYNILSEEDKTVEVTYRGTSYSQYSNEYYDNVVIPESVIYNGSTYNITSIGGGAFSDCPGLKSIEIPNCVTSIGGGAFSDCPGLKSIEIPNSVTSIGSSAFDDCTGLTSVVIGNSVTSIGDWAFSGCTGLKTVINFSNLTFYKGSSSNGYVAYYADKVYNAPNGFIDGDFIWYENEDGMTLAGYLGNATELAMPTDYNGKSVTSIGDDAFEHCTGLTSITIPNSVTSIGYETFRGCTGLTSVVIGNSVTSIEERAFYDCTGLTSVVIPNSVTSIGEKAFYNCTGLTSVVIGNSVTSIGSSAFEGCTGLTSVVIPNSVTSIGNDAFEGTAWYNNLPDGVVYAGKVLYKYKGTMPSNTSIAIKDGTLSIMDDVFKGCTWLTSITIPNSVTSIGSSAFYGCTGLTSIVVDGNNTKYDSRENCNAIIETETNTLIAGCKNTIIPNSVTSIGNYAFYECTGLTSITIPNSITSIGNGAFNNCTSLKELRIEDDESRLSLGHNTCSFNSGKGLFYDCPLETLYLGRNLSYNTNSSYGYSPFYNIETLANVTIGKNVTTIGSYAFYDCSGLTSIVIGNSVTSIGGFAFSSCYRLKTVINFSNLTFSKDSSYGYVAYYADKVYNAPNGFIDGDFIWYENEDGMTLAGYLGNVTELAMPTDYNGKSVTSIGSSAFYGCKGLTSVTIPNSVTSIGDDAFVGCTNIEKLYLDCAEVGDWFSGVSAMKEVTIGNGVTTVVASAFSGCTGLVKVCINDLAAWCGIDFGSADANPLYYANNLYLNGELLTELSIPAELAEVKDYAFYNCNGVTIIDIVDGVKSIGNSAFYGCNDLETLYISNTIESIGNNAFAKCNNILDIKIGSKKAITASENIFSSDAYTNACLYVPTGRKFAYEKATPWDNFYIAEMDFTGIEDVKAENGKVKTIYDFQGRKVDTTNKGIYIINGKKVLIK